MSTITMNRTRIKDYETQMKEFNDFLKDNMDFIKQITPTNPIISKDDEWNNPIYDNYAKSDNIGDD